MIDILIIALLWLLIKTKNNITRVVIMLFFILWQGVPAFNIWRADKLVDELCAKDGGVKVYEKVTLPKERFNEYGQFVIPPDKRYLKPNDEYFMEHGTQILKGNGEYQSLLPNVNKNYFSVIRVKDNKKMGEVIYYGRGGGNPIGPWMGSSYSCPKDIGIEARIFLKDTK